jgi:hypothetical protein
VHRVSCAHEDVLSQAGWIEMRYEPNEMTCCISCCPPTKYVKTNKRVEGKDVVTMPENDEMSLDVASRKFLLSLNNPFRIIDAVSFVNPFL